MIFSPLSFRLSPLLPFPSFLPSSPPLLPPFIFTSRYSPFILTFFFSLFLFFISSLHTVTCLTLSHLLFLFLLPLLSTSPFIYFLHFLFPLNSFTFFLCTCILFFFFFSLLSSFLLISLFFSTSPPALLQLSQHFPFPHYSYSFLSFLFFNFHNNFIFSLLFLIFFSLFPSPLPPLHLSLLFFSSTYFSFPIFFCTHSFHSSLFPSPPTLLLSPLLSSASPSLPDLSPGMKEA